MKKLFKKLVPLALIGALALSGVPEKSFAQGQPFDPIIIGTRNLQETGFVLDLDQGVYDPNTTEVFVYVDGNPVPSVTIQAQRIEDVEPYGDQSYVGDYIIGGLSPDTTYEVEVVADGYYQHHDEFITVTTPHHDTTVTQEGTTLLGDGWYQFDYIWNFDSSLEYSQITGGIGWQWQGKLVNTTKDNFRITLPPTPVGKTYYGETPKITIEIWEDDSILYVPIPTGIGNLAGNRIGTYTITPSTSSQNITFSGFNGYKDGFDNNAEIYIKMKTNFKIGSTTGWSSNPIKFAQK